MHQEAPNSRALTLGLLGLFIVTVFLGAFGGNVFTNSEPDITPGSELRVGPSEVYLPVPGTRPYIVSPGPLAAENWLARLAEKDIYYEAYGADQWLVWASSSTQEELAALLDSSLIAYSFTEKIQPTISQESKQPLIIKVTLFPGVSKQQVAHHIEAEGAKVLRGLDQEGQVLLVEIAAGQLPFLEEVDGIRTAEQHEAPEFLNDRARAITGTDFLSLAGVASAAGLTGSGQIVGVADSGLDRGRLDNMHPDLANIPGQMPKVALLHSWAGGGTADPNGHGTHLAATVAGTGVASQGRYQGVAPEASLYFQALLSADNNLEPPLDLVSLFRPAYEAGVRVHINGWGGQSNSYRAASAQIDRFVQYCPEFLPVFGAGNSGPASGTLTPEANSKNALVIGAAQTPRPAYGPESQDSASPAALSSRGPTADGRIKPDLLAPGTSVISARSALSSGNFLPNDKYTRMQGTSMAAAVGGGAAVLLREYFQEEEHLQPSAALLRAVLVNGARPLREPAQGETFGVLDLGASVLALREKTFAYTDNLYGIRQQEERTYTFQVTDTSAPFRATLTWSDPPAAAGAPSTLVNDLDLTVTAPDGEAYYGNDFNRAGRPDRVNNTEKVEIFSPAPGTYTVTVRAPRVAVNAVSGRQMPAQSYALAYGTPPARGIAASKGPESLTTVAGAEIRTTDTRLSSLVDGQRAGARPQDVPTGAELYIFGTPQNPRAVYAVAARWDAGAVKLVDNGDGEEPVLVRVSPQKRDGGFRLDPHEAGRILLNGEEGSVRQMPSGARVRAVINPVTQNLWRVAAQYELREGLLAAVSEDQQSIRLLGSDRWLSLDPDAAVTISDEFYGEAWPDRPFGAATPSRLDQLQSGSKVQLVLDPDSGRVQYINAHRLLAVGPLLSMQADSLTLKDGSQLTLFSGVTARRDGTVVPLTHLRPGDHIRAVLLPDNQEVLTLEAYSRVLYGEILYGGSNRLYLADQYDRFWNIDFGPDSTFFRWGLQVDAQTLSPGHWVRVTLQPQTARALRVDIAGPPQDLEAGALELWEAETGLARIEGRDFRWGAYTAVKKAGYPIPAEYLRPGDRLQFTALSAAGNGQVLFQVAAQAAPHITSPELQVSALPLAEQTMLSGFTSGDRVYAAHQDGSFTALPLQDGVFDHPVERRGGEQQIAVVAVDSGTGAVSGRQLDLPKGAAALAPTDISGHWAYADIRALMQRGLMAGYPDGTFGPNRAVTRAEMSAVLVRLLGWPADDDDPAVFRDAADIPPWAQGAVAAAHANGVVSGYPDGTFRPHSDITRAEAAAMLTAALTNFTNSETAEPPPYGDWQRVPQWARTAVAQAYVAGLFRGRPDGLFDPAASVSRAELAASLNRFIESGQGQ